MHALMACILLYNVEYQSSKAPFICSVILCLHLKKHPCLTLPIEKQLFFLEQRLSMTKGYYKTCLHIILHFIIGILQVILILWNATFTLLCGLLIHQLSTQALLVSQGFPCSRINLYSKRTHGSKCVSFIVLCTDVIFLLFVRFIDQCTFSNQTLPLIHLVKCHKIKDLAT